MDNVKTVRDLQALSPKWDLYLIRHPTPQPPLQGSENYAERRWKDSMNQTEGNSKKTASSSLDGADSQ